jgi:hypothetical protein
MNIVNPFTREFWIRDEDVRAAVRIVPPPGPKAVQQARLSAIALEGDREQLRMDIARRLRENRDEREELEAALDAIRILETAT